MTAEDAVTGRAEPYLLYTGPSSASAGDVIDEAKRDERDSDEASKTAQAAYWIKDTLDRNGPMPTKDFEAQAKADGAYHSRNTFDRARKIAGVRTHKQGNQWWVSLAGQAEPSNSPNFPRNGPVGGDGGDPK